MYTVTIEGTEHKLDCNALTPLYYSEQFLMNRDGHMVAEDINDAIAGIVTAVDAGSIPPMLKMQQLMWAFEKTACPDTTPGFREWAAAMPPSMLGLTVGGEWAEVVTEIVKEFFCPSPTEEDMGATATREAAS